MALLKKLAALEEFDNDFEDVPEPENIAEATEVESSLIEAQENEEELNDMEADLDVAEDAEEALEELIVSLEAAVERGGMDHHEARLYNLNRKTIYGMMGQKIDRHRQVSIESFSGASSRLTATKIALEEEKGTFTKWWEAIVRFIKNAVTKTVDFVVGLFDACKALENRAVQMMKKAKDKDTKFEGKLTKDQKKKYAAKFSMTKNNPANVNGLQDWFNLVSIVGAAVKPLTAAAALYSKGVDRVVSFIKSDKVATGMASSTAKGFSSAYQAAKSEAEEKAGVKSTTAAIEQKVMDEGGGKEVEEGADKIEDIMVKIARDISGSSVNKMPDDIKEKLKEESSDSSIKNKIPITGNFEGYWIILNVESLLETRENAVAEKGQVNGMRKIWISYDKLIEIKEDEKVLFNEEDLTKENVIKTLQAVSKLAVDFKGLNKDIKQFNYVFLKAVNNMDSKARGVGESITSFFKKILGSIKSLFGNASGMSKWYRHSISIVKDILNLLSIRMSDAKGDDKKDEDKEGKEEKTGDGEGDSGSAETTEETTNKPSKKTKKKTSS